MNLDDAKAGRLEPGDLGTLLGIWAHPDDEAYLSAGLMAAARAAGNRVVVMTATLGEHGTDDPARWPPAELAAERRLELAESLAAVDVVEHIVFDYEDGSCSRVPQEAAIERVAAVIESVRPDTVLTFGPDGMTGHADHRTVSAWATTAWRRNGSRGRLWYATTTSRFHQCFGDLNQRAGIWSESAAPVASADELAMVFACDPATRERKFAALRAHRTQTTGLIDLVGPDAYRIWWAEEAFVAAAPEPSTPQTEHEQVI